MLLSSGYRRHFIGESFSLEMIMNEKERDTSVRNTDATQEKQDIPTKGLRRF